MLPIARGKLLLPKIGSFHSWQMDGLFCVRQTGGLVRDDYGRKGRLTPEPLL
jgi:hypothetical protein